MCQSLISRGINWYGSLYMVKNNIYLYWKDKRIKGWWHEWQSASKQLYLHGYGRRRTRVTVWFRSCLLWQNDGRSTWHSALQLENLHKMRFSPGQHSTNSTLREVSDETPRMERGMWAKAMRVERSRGFWGVPLSCMVHADEFPACCWLLHYINSRFHLKPTTCRLDAVKQKEGRPDKWLRGTQGVPHCNIQTSALFQEDFSSNSSSLGFLAKCPFSSTCQTPEKR